MLGAVCAALVWLAGRTPAPLPASAPDAQFSADRAMVHVRAIAQRPHPSGSPEHARVREYLVATLKTLGLEPEIQETTGVGTHNAVAGHVLNVLARLPGRSGSGPAVLLAAHYDSVPAAPGAGDDGAAVAALLETVRALRAGAPLVHDVIVLFSDGEESGLTGAAAFVREHPRSTDVGVALNFEGRGTAGPSAMFETGPGNLDAVTVLSGAPLATASSFAASLYRLLPNDTDVSELAASGRPALNFSFAGGVERYHTSSDDVEHLDAGSVQHHGELALALARAFGDGPLPRPRETTSGDAVFFNLPGLGLIVYPAFAALPIAAVALLMIVLLIARLRRRETTAIRDIALGIGGLLLSALMAVALAIGIDRVFDRIAGGPASSAGGVRELYAAAIALLASSVATACWIFVRRRASVAGAHAGAVLVWTLMAIGVAWRLPGASYLFVWPALAAATMAIAGGRVVQWVAAIGVLAVLVPAVWSTAVVTLGMSGPGASVMSLCVSMTCWLLAPHLETMSGESRAPLTLGGAAVALLLAAAATARPSAAHPEPSMLAYAFDADAGHAWLLTPATARRGSWAARALGASAHVIAPPDWRTRAIAGEMPTLAADAPNIAVGVPALEVAADTSTPQERRLNLVVHPAPGTYSIRVRAVGARVLASAVDGKTIDVRRYRSASPEWTLGFVAPPPDGFSLTLAVPNDSPLELDVIARSLGLPQGLTIAPRPSGTVPIHSGDQTVVHRRFALAPPSPRG